MERVGGGLDITARELLGEGKTSVDLFREAESGNERAKNAISDAVRILGRGENIGKVVLTVD